MTRIFTAAAIALIATQAAAQQNRNCAPRDEVVERLASTYGESRQSVGLGEVGTMIETFASADTGTWTITVTTPDMMTCLVASGQSWEALADAMPPQGKEGHGKLRRGDKL